MKPDMKADAKMKMLQELKRMATDMMGGDLKGKLDGMKKVTVAAPDEKGLEAGLEKAKDIVGKEQDPMEMAEDMMEDEGEETPESTPEELQEKIKELQAKLEELKK